MTSTEQPWTLVIRVRINRRAAILARKVIAGIVPVDIRPEDLALLSDSELIELADIVDKDEVVESDRIVEATFDAVTHVLKDRVQQKTAALEAAKAADAERRGADARAAEAELVRKREFAKRDADYAAAITAWIDENGDDEMKERHRAGFLATDEIIDEVMHQTFEINEDEHVALRKEEACDCDRGCMMAVRFSIAPVIPNLTPLDSRQYATLERVRESAPNGATVEPRIHKAACPECKCTPIVRLAARVSLEWNGWLLVKEYALG